MKRKLVICLYILFSSTIFAQSESTTLTPSYISKYISPTDLGYDTCTSNISRYRILYNTHITAIEQGLYVDYNGLDSIFLEIPDDAKSIPLTTINDFKNAIFVVLNNTKNLPLFSMSQPSMPIEIDKKEIDSLNFQNHQEVSHGATLLILTDSTPWINQRIGYGYPVFRKDILLLKDGTSTNAPVFQYNTDATRLHCRYVNVTEEQKTIENLNIVRQHKSTYKTYAININNQHNVLLRNITIVTPKSKMIADAAINISNSTQISLEDITIRGTYSGYGRFTDYGYGIAMNNVWNSSFLRLDATGNWGIFGTNNLSHVILKECKLNRFDIHCYGKDVHCIGCTFVDKQTQFSSMYGKIQFDSCTFVDCIPLRIRSSYNAYTPFDIEMNNCTFKVTHRNRSLVNVMLLDTNLNSRPELAEKCWPNLTINTMKVIAPNNLRHIFLFNPTGKIKECRKPVGHISLVAAYNVSVVNEKGKTLDTDIELSSVQFSTKNQLEFILNPLKP